MERIVFDLICEVLIMSYKIEDNCITEIVDNIFDNEDRKYHLKINYFYDRQNKCQMIYIFMIRNKRKAEVGRAYCIFKSSEDLLLADIIIHNDVKFESIADKLFKLRYRNEPTNYQRKGVINHSKKQSLLRMK